MTFFCIKYQSLNALKLWMFQRPEIYKVCFIFEGFIVRHCRNAFGSGVYCHDICSVTKQQGIHWAILLENLASKETTASFVIRSVLKNELCTKNYCFSGLKFMPRAMFNFRTWMLVKTRNLQGGTVAFWPPDEEFLLYHQLGKILWFESNSCFSILLRLW